MPQKKEIHIIVHLRAAEGLFALLPIMRTEDGSFALTTIAEWSAPFPFGDLGNCVNEFRKEGLEVYNNPTRPNFLIMSEHGDQKALEAFNWLIAWAHRS